MLSSAAPQVEGSRRRLTLKVGAEKLSFLLRAIAVPKAKGDHKPQQCFTSYLLCSFFHLLPHVSAFGDLVALFFLKLRLQLVDMSFGLFTYTWFNHFISKSGFYILYAFWVILIVKIIVFDMSSSKTSYRNVYNVDLVEEFTV